MAGMVVRVPRSGDRQQGLVFGMLVGSLGVLIAWWADLVRRRPTESLADPASQSTEAAAQMAESEEFYVNERLVATLLEHIRTLESRLASVEQRQLEVAGNLEQANQAFRRLVARLNKLASARD